MDQASREVDLIVWHKATFGMGFRSRRTCEFVKAHQKPPVIAKGAWLDKTIPDVWTEAPPKSDHPHPKPHLLQKRLIECVTQPGDLVVDPAAGSFSVLHACRETGRDFMGTDLLAPAEFKLLASSGETAQEGLF